MKSQKNLKKFSSRVFSPIITGIILTLLILSAPTQAFTLSISMDKTSVTKGNNVSFNLNVDINSNENLPVDKIVLELDGYTGTTYSCSFDVNGNILSGCSGMTIIKTISAVNNYGYGYGYYDRAYNFGYGYGYGNGKLSYIITLNTDSYSTGQYRTKVYLYAGAETFVEEGNDLTIRSSTVSGGTYNSNYYTNHYGRASSASYDSVCLNAWVCSDWSVCINGEQTRTCAQTMSSCLLSTRPTEKIECVKLESKPSDNTIVVSAGGNSNGYNTEGNESSDSENIKQNSFGGITGAVIGVVNSKIYSSVLILILLAGMIGLLIGLIIVKSVQNKRREEKIRRLRQIMWIPPKK